MKKIMTIILTIFVGILIVGMVSAAPSEADISGVSDLGTYTMTSADTASVLAGHVHTADVNSNMSTARWAGLLGNVTGNIILGDGSNDTLFSWANAGGNLVYASTAADPVWASIADATNSDMPTFLTGGSDSDNYASTFVGGSENIGSNLYTLSSDYATTLSAASVWKTYSLKSGSDLIWAGKVVEDGTSYSGSTVDYQMIIPEDGTAGDTTATAYNLWVELV